MRFVQIKRSDELSVWQIKRSWLYLQCMYTCWLLGNYFVVQIMMQLKDYAVPPLSPLTGDPVKSETMCQLSNDEFWSLNLKPDPAHQQG